MEILRVKCQTYNRADLGFLGRIHTVLVTACLKGYGVGTGGNRCRVEVIFNVDNFNRIAVLEVKCLRVRPDLQVGIERNALCSSSAFLKKLTA